MIINNFTFLAFLIGEKKRERMFDSNASGFMKQKIERVKNGSKD